MVVVVVVVTVVVVVVVVAVVVVRAAADDVAWHLAVWEPFRNRMHGLLVRGCIDVSFLCASRHGMHPPGQDGC